MVVANWVTYHWGKVAIPFINCCVFLSYSITCCATADHTKLLSGGWRLFLSHSPNHCSTAPQNPPFSSEPNPTVWFVDLFSLFMLDPDPNPILEPNGSGNWAISVVDPWHFLERFRIRGSVQLTYGSESCSFRHWPSKWQKKIRIRINLRERQKRKQKFKF